MLMNNEPQEHNSRLKKAMNAMADQLKPALTALLAPIAEQEDAPAYETLVRLASHAFNTAEPTRGMVKSVKTLLFGFPEPDLALLTLLRPLSQGKHKFSHDALIQRIHSQQSPISKEAAYAFRALDIPLLLKHIRPERLLQLLWTSHAAYLRDMVNMMIRIESHLPDLKYIPEKPKTIESIHNCCVRLMPKINQKDFDLHQREDILLLNGLSAGDELTVWVPRTHYHLIELGESLNFCVGNGTYSEEVVNQRSSIVAVCKNKKPVFGVQFNRYRLLQAKGFGNEEQNAPDPALLSKLQELLIAEPTMVRDFLPITDSYWVRGYKYTDEDLFLLLNDWIYVYKNVPQHVYEALLDSDQKGRFVNQKIKPVYRCERVGELGQLDEAA